MSKTTTRLVLVLVAAGILTGCTYDVEIVTLSDGRDCIVELPRSKWLRAHIRCESELVK